MHKGGKSARHSARRRTDMRAFLPCFRPSTQSSEGGAGVATSQWPHVHSPATQKEQHHQQHQGPAMQPMVRGATVGAPETCSGLQHLDVMCRSISGALSLGQGAPHASSQQPTGADRVRGASMGRLCPHACRIRAAEVGCGSTCTLALPWLNTLWPPPLSRIRSTTGMWSPPSATTSDLRSEGSACLLRIKAKPVQFLAHRHPSALVLCMLPLT